MAKSLTINSTTYNDVSEIDVPVSGGGTAKYYETSADDAAAADILISKKAHGATGEITGSMPNNSALNGSISTKAGTVAIPAGYHNGSGSVAIAAAEQAKVIAANIKSGVTLLGVAGSLSTPSISLTSGVLSIS